MTPEIIELGKVIGLPAAVLLYMWMNRAPAPKDTGASDKPVLDKLDAMEDRIIDLQAKVEVLLDRKK